ncbi:MAG: hypothetical protein AAF907_08860, partial [Planctomycetota bacterium]
VLVLRRSLLVLATAAGAGCATRPGYVDATTGRAYAGFAKPAFYLTDLEGLCGVKECDCRRDPYNPPVEAFTSFVGLDAGCCLLHPRPNTTHVCAPMPARYQQFPGAAYRSQDSPAYPPSDAMPGEPNPLAAPMPLPESTQPPTDDRDLPELENSPDASARD